MSSTKKAPTSSDATVTATADLSSLLRNASLTNSKLFGAIFSSIKSSASISRDGKEWMHSSARGRDAIVSIVRSAAIGAAGYVSSEDWVRQYDDAHSAYQSIAGRDGDQERGLDGDCAGRSLGKIANDDMPSDGHALRLRAALDAVDATAVALAAQPHPKLSSISNNFDDNSAMTVRQAVGLLRGAALVGNGELQSRALDCLVRIVPRLASHPFEILAAVQTPILRLLDWNCLGELSAFTFKLESQRRSFQNIINYGKLEEDSDEKNEGITRTSNSNGNHKRRRPWKDTDESEQSIINGNDTSQEDKIMLMRMVEAAHLARRGDQRGAKHGAVLCIPAEDSICMEGLAIQSPNGLQRVIGRGWNHNVLLDSSKGKNKIVLHSEVHAVADAIRRFGEEVCFERLFPRATVLIVELFDDCAYEKCHPCPKCNTFLRAVGITRAVHSTSAGKMDETYMKPNPELLAKDVARVPFCAACNEMQIECKRLEEKGT